LIDSHAHLESYTDIDAVIRRAREAGVEAVLAVGAGVESSRRAIELAELYPGYVYAGVGFHPSEMQKEDAEAAVEFVENNLSRAAAVGEVGLDYSYSFAKPKEVRQRQRELYVRLLEAARDAGLPVSVHSRSAYKDALRLLVEHGPERAVFHWYDGPLHTLEEILDHGFSVSATPAITYSKGLRAVMERAPLERILVETDCPVYLRGAARRSEPGDVRLTVEGLAELKGVSLGEAAAATGCNARALFGLR